MHDGCRKLDWQASEKQHRTNVVIFKTCTGGGRTDTDLMNKTTIKRRKFSSVMRSESSKEPHYIKETARGAEMCCIHKTWKKMYHICLLGHQFLWLSVPKSLASNVQYACQYHFKIWFWSTHTCVSKLQSLITILWETPLEMWSITEWRGLKTISEEAYDLHTGFKKKFSWISWKRLLDDNFSHLGFELLNLWKACFSH